MSWFNLFFQDYVTYRNLQEVDRKIKRIDRKRRSNRSSNIALAEQVKSLQEDLGRMSLMTCTLLELGLKKGAFTQQELLETMDQLDLSDGEADGKLDPKWMSTPETPEATEEAEAPAEAAERPNRLDPKPIVRRRRR